MLLLECKPDEVLAMSLGWARKDIYHLHDKGRVCNRLAKSTGLRAMVDEDPGSAEAAYLRDLGFGRATDTALRVVEDPIRAHRIVILRPRLEEWIISAASASKVQMAEFGLENRGNALHREITSRLPNFQRLLAALLERRSAHLLALQQLIRT